MTEQEEKFLSLFMGECWHEHHSYYTSRKDFKQHCSCGAILEDSELLPHLAIYNIPNDEPTFPKVHHFMESTYPEMWEKYLRPKMLHAYLFEGTFSKSLRDVLNLSDLVQFLLQPEQVEKWRLVEKEWPLEVQKYRGRVYTEDCEAYSYALAEGMTKEVSHD
jgi:hypothetical protein